MHDEIAKKIWKDGWNAALREAAKVVAADIDYKTMELTGGTNVKRLHHRVAQGSSKHADAILALKQ